MDLLCEPIEIPIKCRKAYYVGCCVMIGINLAKQLLCGLRPTNLFHKKKHHTGIHFVAHFKARPILHNIVFVLFVKMNTLLAQLLLSLHEKIMGKELIY